MRVTGRYYLFLKGALTLCLLAGAPLALGDGSPSDLDFESVTRGLQSHSFQQRRHALGILATRPGLLQKPAIQHRVIGLLRRESKNPAWDRLEDDSVQYELYYGALLDLTKELAASHHVAEAWPVLADANYNDDSDFAKWLASQPEALPILIKQADRPDEHSRSTATYVIAEALARCIGESQLSGCTNVIGEKQKILSILRSKADSDPQARLSAVRGLGICGEPQDLPLLGRLAESAADPWFVKLAKESIQEIENRNAGGR